MYTFAPNRLYCTKMTLFFIIEDRQTQVLAGDTMATTIITYKKSWCPWSLSPATCSTASACNNPSDSITEIVRLEQFDYYNQNEVLHVNMENMGFLPPTVCLSVSLSVSLPLSLLSISISISISHSLSFSLHIAVLSQVLNVQHRGFVAAIVYNVNSDELITMAGGKGKLLLIVLQSMYNSLQFTCAKVHLFWKFRTLMDQAIV